MPGQYHLRQQMGPGRLRWDLGRLLIPSADADGTDLAAPANLLLLLFED